MKSAEKYSSNPEEIIDVGKYGQMYLTKTYANDKFKDPITGKNSSSGQVWKFTVIVGKGRNRKVLSPHSGNWGEDFTKSKRGAMEYCKKLLDDYWKNFDDESKIKNND